MKSSMVADYGYPNARIRAMKSYLFDRGFYQKLLDMEDVSEIISALENTQYKKDIEEGIIKYPGASGVDEGLRRNISSTFRKIEKMVQDEQKQLLDVLLGRFDVHNIKTVLRAKNVGASEDEIVNSYIPAGSLEEALLIELARQKDIRSCIDILALWNIPYAVVLTRKFSEFSKNQRLATLELEVDKYYYNRSIKISRRRSLSYRLVKEILSREIDSVNIMTILRLIKEEMTVEEMTDYFIEGGKEISLEKYLLLAREEDIEGIIEEMGGTSFGKLLKENLKEFYEIQNISFLERLLEEMLIKKCVNMFKADPLSIAIIIGYIWAKYNEIVNLRIIVRGKSVGMPEDKIREALVFV